MDNFKKELKDSANDIKIPSSLSPEEMKKKLENMAQSDENIRNIENIEKSKNIENVENIENKSKNSFLQRWRKRKTIGIITTAASLMLIATAAIHFGKQFGLSTASSELDSSKIAVESSKETAKETTRESSEENNSEQTSSTTSSKALSPTFSKFYYTTTYDEIKKKVKNSWISSMARTYGGTSELKMEIAEETMDAVTADTGAGSIASKSNQSSSYSSTNLQVEGVDEGDIIKTDGTYFYILTDTNQVRIVDAKTLKEISSISDQISVNEKESKNQDENQNKNTDGIQYEEMYVAKNRLILTGNVYKNSLKEQDENTYYMDKNVQTVLLTYDLTNPKKPKLLGTIHQDGTYNTSRKVGDYIYLFSDYSHYPTVTPRYGTVPASGYTTEENAASSQIDKSDEAKIIPTINQTPILADDIYVSREVSGCNYLVISSIDLKNPSKTADQKSLMEFGNRFHITKESIYAIQTDWSQDTQKTNIVRFSFKDGKISPVDASTLAGELTDTFAINETSSHLRVLLTCWSSQTSTQSNSVYVLDRDMKVVGKIENLAPGETIYSARFMGDIGYFVTYRNTDPLFSVDFSEPENPKIIGELKITGFSDYLHFYGKDKLFGLGKETDPNTGEFLGIKLSMFDISNPKNVKEEKKLVLKGVDDCDALDNYKAILVDKGKNLIGFSVKTYDNNVSNCNYLLFSYDEKKGFTKKFDYGFTKNSRSSYSSYRYYDYYGYSGDIRGIYINSTFYIADRSQIVSFDMKNGFKQIKNIDLD